MKCEKYVDACRREKIKGMFARQQNYHMSNKQIEFIALSHLQMLISTVKHIRWREWEREMKTDLVGMYYLYLLCTMMFYKQQQYVWGCQFIWVHRRVNKLYLSLFHCESCTQVRWQTKQLDGVTDIFRFSYSVFIIIVIITLVCFGKIICSELTHGVFIMKRQSAR